MPSSSSSPIVLLEDDPDDRFFVRQAIRDADIANPLVTFRSVETARAYFENVRGQGAAPPALFILDVFLAGEGTGIDFLRWVRTQPSPLGETPAMIVSGSDDLQHRQDTEQLGALCFLQKPVREQTFIQAVQALGYTIDTQKLDGVQRFIARPVIK